MLERPYLRLVHSIPVDQLPMVQDQGREARVLALAIVIGLAVAAVATTTALLPKRPAPKDDL